MTITPETELNLMYSYTRSLQLNDEAANLSETLFKRMLAEWHPERRARLQRLHRRAVARWTRRFDSAFKEYNRC